MEQNIAFGADERLHQDQWQFSCHKMWCKVILFYTVCPKTISTIHLLYNLFLNTSSTLFELAVKSNYVYRLYTYICATVRFSASIIFDIMLWYCKFRNFREVFAKLRRCEVSRK